MRMSSIGFKKVINLGNYESYAVNCEYELNDGDSYEEALADFTEVVSDIEHKIEKAEDAPVKKKPKVTGGKVKKAGPSPY